MLFHTAKQKRKINFSKGQKHTKGDLLFYCALLLIPLVQVGIFYFGVNIQSICMAFQTYEADTGTFVWNISKNFQQFAVQVQSSGFWKMVSNSVIVFLCSTIFSTGFSLLFSYYIYKKRFLSNFFKFVLFLPSVLPGILLVVMYKTYLQEAIPAYQAWFGGIKEVIKPLDNPNLTFFIVTAYTIWLSFGSQVLIYTGAMDQVSPEIIEAGKIDGANSFVELVHIIFPTILPTLSTFLLAGVAGIFTSQNNLYSFFGNNVDPADKTIGYELYKLVREGMGSYCYASFFGMVCTLVALPLTLGLRKLLLRAQR